MTTETKKTKQKMRYSDEELSLVKVMFADNDELVKTIRKVILQVALSSDEKKIVKSIDKDILAVIRKTILPTLDADAPLAQIGDLLYWITFKMEEKTADECLLLLQVRQKLIKYLDARLSVLEGGADVSQIKFNSLSIIDDRDADEVYVDMFTRNLIIGHTESMLQQLVNLGNQTSPTVEQAKDIMRKNSAK